MKIAEIVKENISPLFKGDIKLVDVEYTKKNDGMHLVIYIDKPNGITIEDCVEVNHLIDDKLEELNPTEDKPYHLDVSSYGLDKPLKFDWQFKKYENQKVIVKLYHKINDLKEFVAVLKSKTDSKIKLEINNEIQEFNLADVASVLPYLEF